MFALILSAAFLLLQLPGTSSPAVDADLEDCVTAYWKALEQRDKVSALGYVYPDDLNNFLLRAEAPFLNWTLREIEASGEEATVSSTFERIVAGSRLTQQFKETWVKTDRGWKVRVPKPQHIADRIMETARKLKARELPRELSVVPATVRFYAIVPNQPATISIRNGLDSPAHLIEFHYDENHIEVLESTERIEPGETGLIRLRFKGGVDELNQETSVRLTLEQDLEKREFELPLIYNYSDGITRWATRKKNP